LATAVTGRDRRLCFPCPASGRHSGSRAG